jgi:hypothetical protein
MRCRITHLGKTPMRLLPLSLVIAALIVCATLVLVFELSTFVAFLQNPYSDFNHYYPLRALGALFSFMAYDPRSLMIFEPGPASPLVDTSFLLRRWFGKAVLSVFQGS